jgi:hypothetical protein
MHWIAWFLGIVLVFVGAAKLVGGKTLADQFAEFGLGPRAMRFVGVLEVAAGLGMPFDPIGRFAALGTAALMLGAVYQHRRVGHPWRTYIPSVVILFAAAALAFLSF